MPLPDGPVEHLPQQLEVVVHSHGGKAVLLTPIPKCFDVLRRNCGERLVPERHPARDRKDIAADRLEPVAVVTRSSQQCAPLLLPDTGEGRERQRRWARRGWRAFAKGLQLTEKCRPGS